MADAQRLEPRQRAVLVVSVFVAGLCSLVYELLIGTTSSYFLGDSIKQFSVTIGLFMAAMGVGSYVSKAMRTRDVLGQFVGVEVALGLVGGVSVPVLYLVYATTDLYAPAMYGFIVTIGALTGLEIPLLVRAMRDHYTLETNLANILSLDYLGALGATLLFPFVLLPWLGTFRSSLVVGLLNLAVALLVLRTFRDHIPRRMRRRGVALAGAACVGVVATLAFADQLLRPWHDAVYEDRVVYSRQSPYQKIVLTRGKSDVRLFLNGNLQFASIDEYRYHEALVHPVMAAAPRHEQILVLGGGEGLALREILKHPDVGQVTVVDLDPAVVELGRTHPLVRELNGGSLDDPRVKVVNTDAFKFVEDAETLYDVVIADLPDPNNASLSRLYSHEFYALLRRHLAKSGVMVTQATSPYFARKAFWTIVETMRGAGLHVHPYHAYVPSFGDWGFVLAADRPLAPETLKVTVPTRYLDDELLRGLFTIEKDLRVSPRPRVSTLDAPLVLGAYLDGWKHWN